MANYPYIIPVTQSHLEHCGYTVELVNKGNAYERMNLFVVHG